MSLTQKQKRQLKALAHHLKPVVMVGQHGLTEGVFNELESALDAHELIKVRLSGAERDERREMQQAICTRTDAQLIQQIGHVAVYFRRNLKKPRIALP
jgi:RNA-binding protein